MQTTNKMKVTYTEVEGEWRYRIEDEGNWDLSGVVSEEELDLLKSGEPISLRITDSEGHQVELRDVQIVSIEGALPGKAITGESESMICFPLNIPEGGLKPPKNRWEV